MGTKFGQDLNGMLLRRRRYELLAEGKRKRLKDIAQEAGYESINLLSYIERGMGAVTANHVPGIARAYELDEEEYWLFWSLTRLLDEKVPGTLLNDIFDRTELWTKGDDTPDGSPRDTGGQSGGTNGDPPGPGTGSPTRRAASALFAYLRRQRERDTAQAPLESAQTYRGAIGRLIRSSPLSLWLQNLNAGGLFLSIDESVYIESVIQALMGAACTSTSNN